MDQQLNYLNRFFLDKNDKSKAFWDKDFHKLLQSEDNFTQNNENCICLYKKGKILNKMIPRYYSIQGCFLLYGDSEIKGFRKLENVYMKTIQDTSSYPFQIQLTYNFITLTLFSNNELEYFQFKQKLEQFCILIDFHNQFAVINQIGFGSTAHVFVCRQLSNNEYFAIKRIRKNSKLNPKFLMEEISIMHELEHPNILKLFKVFETNKHINMVLELVEGGELLKRHRYNIKDARTIFKQLLQCVDYMHQKGIMHRDLKPQNVLCKTHSLDIVLADFGLATWTKAKQHFYYRCGTTGYVAPEILQYKEGSKMYNEKCDIFSLGVILYQLVFNNHPFKDADKKIVLKKNISVDYKFDENNKAPASCKDMIQQMLRINPKQRPSASELLRHEFFNEILLEQSNVNLTLSQQDSFSEQKRSGPSLSFHHADMKFSTINLGFKAFFEDEIDDKKEAESNDFKELSPIWSKRIGLQRQLSQRSQASSVVIQRQQSQDLKKPKTSIFRSELKYSSLQILSPFEIKHSQEIHQEIHQIPYINYNNMLLQRIKS